MSLGSEPVAGQWVAPGHEGWCCSTTVASSRGIWCSLGLNVRIDKTQINEAQFVVLTCFLLGLKLKCIMRKLVQGPPEIRPATMGGDVFEATPVDGSYFVRTRRWQRKFNRRFDDPL